MINVACSNYPTFNGTLSAPWFFGKPVPSDRLPCWRLTPRAPWRLYSAPGVMPPIKIKSESKVGMRHGQSPRYADMPYAWLLTVHPCHCRYGAVWGYPSLLLTDFRRLERQFLDPISTHQNKVRDVTKESQGMDLVWSISPKSGGLSDCVCFWHLAHVQATPINVRVKRKNGHRADVMRCLLMTQNGHAEIRADLLFGQGAATRAANFRRADIVERLYCRRVRFLKPSGEFPSPSLRSPAILSSTYARA